jgi:tryptophanyl-tRNA synthetase
MLPSFRVTPWEVRGDRIDYERLLCDFGIERIDSNLKVLIRKILGDNHLIDRDVFFAHKNLRGFLLGIREGDPSYIFTGRGASGPMHIGNLVPLMLAKFIQEKLNSPLYFQISDDEKYSLRPDLSFREVRRWARENIVDVLAFFDGNVKIIWDSESSWLYPASLIIAKKLRIAELKSFIKLDDASNPAILYYALLQSLPALMFQLFRGKYRCIVPMAVDQHPLMMPSLIAARRLGLEEPALIHSVFLPGINGEPKMGTSDPSSAIFLTDAADSVSEKIDRSSCSELPPSLHYLRAFDTQGYEDALASYIENKAYGCEEAKRRAKDILINLIEDHRRKRREFIDKVDEYILREPPLGLDLEMF